MNIREKIYGLFILGIEGGNLESALESGLGGVIFFTNDIKSENQFKNLIKEIKNKGRENLLLSIDQEGGRVERTENIHNGKKYLSAKHAYQKGVLQEQTQAIARELANYGINLNFAPCIDVNTNPNNPIIGERAFSSRSDEVTNGGRLVMETYIKEGIIPCVKHYPGHGDAQSDSHLALPKINLTLQQMENEHLRPFRALIDAPMLMVAHLHCTCFDKDVVPTSMSANAIKYLRENMHYKGIVISDDMIMKGVQGFSLERAMLAGVNMFIFRNSTDETIQKIDALVSAATANSRLKDCIEKSYSLVQALKTPR